MSIRWKLLLWYTCVLALAGCALVVALYFFTAHQMRREADKFLLDECEEWRRAYLEHDGDLPALEALLAADTALRRYFPVMVRFYNSHEQRDILFAGNTAWRDVVRAKSGYADPGTANAYSSVPVGRHGRPLRLLAIRVVPQESGLVLQGGIYTRRLESRLARLRVFLAISIVTVIGLATLGGRILVVRSLEPIDRAATELEHVRSGNLSYRLPIEPTGDEVERLRRAINHMLDRLESAFKRVEGFTADAAHELRTPLAATKCRIDVALERSRSEEEYRHAMTDVMADVNGLVRLVGDLLLLARMDATDDMLHSETVALCELTDDLREVFTLSAEEKGLALTMTCDPDCQVQGDRALLRRLLANLLDNALRCTPTGRVSLTVQRDGPECVIAVEDTGIGIAPEAQNRVFERFFRADPARTRESGGVGLGLSICHSIVQRHKGRIRVTSAPGKGSRFEVVLPAE